MAGPPTTDDGRSKPEWGASAPRPPGPPGPHRRPNAPDGGPAGGPTDAKAKRAEARQDLAQQAAARRARMEEARTEKALAKQARADGAGGGRRPPAPKGRGRGAPARATPPAKVGRTAAPAARPKGRGKAAPARPKAGKRPAAAKGAFRQRYGVVHDVDGPRVRLGVCWFVVALGAIVLGPMTTAMAYAPAAALAAAQTARAWRKQGPQPSDVMAAGGAGLVSAGALLGAGGVGLGILGCVVLAFVGAAGDSRSPNPRIADIGWTLQCALAPAAVAASMVLLSRLDQGSAIGLLLLVSVYETGDYLIGSGSVNPYEGPGAGAAGIVVITFILSTLPISALSFGEAWAFGGLVALLAPAGQLVASALLPSATTPASGLRRLDSLLLVAPLWAWGIGLIL